MDIKDKGWRYERNVFALGINGQFLLVGPIKRIVTQLINCAQ